MGDADSMYNIGLVLYHGDGMRQDRAKAAKWWRKAANLGHSKAGEALAANFKP
jgi:TPR repeat protein